jgi:hypothetical protein
LGISIAVGLGDGVGSAVAVDGNSGVEVVWLQPVVENSSGAITKKIDILFIGHSPLKLIEQ